MAHKNPEDKKLYQRKYRLTTTGRASEKRYYEAHKKEVLARNKIWNEAHPEERKARGRKYARTLKGRYKTLLENAKKRHILVEISFEEYCEIVSTNKCHYGIHTLPVAGSGLDRVDNRMTYSKDNVVPCCSDCNEKKGGLEMVGFTYPRTVELLKELLEVS